MSFKFTSKVGIQIKRGAFPDVGDFVADPVRPGMYASSARGWDMVAVFGALWDESTDG